MENILKYHMKTILTYNQLNESYRGSEYLEKLLLRFEEKIDNKRLSQFLLSYKREVDIICRKYYENGVINGNKILSDLKSLSLMKEEMEYDDDQKNNIILRYLYKFFVKWPRNLVSGLWRIFHITVIEQFQNGGTLEVLMGSIMAILYSLVAIIVCIISVHTFLFFDMKLNGLTEGKVVKNKFESSHTEHYTQSVIVGKSVIQIPQTRFVPDRWHVDIAGKDGRIESWVTYYQGAANLAKPGVEIKKDDNWSWEGTEKR